MSREKDRKEGLADEERSQRAYDETYGRGGGESFDEPDYPRSYGGTGTGGWRRALRAYVDGHDRNWGAERKLEEAGEEQAKEPRPGRREEPERTPGPDAPSSGAEREATARTDRGRTPFGVEVPDRDEMVFHRSASTWRDRLPRADRFPRHADRGLDGHRGTGDQA